MVGELMSLNKLLSYFYISIKSLLVSFICLMIVLLSFFVYYFGDLLLNPSKVPAFGAYIIVSKSMTPTINVGDCVIIKRMNNDNYRIGDIITYDMSDSNNPNFLVTHRVVNKRVIDSGDSFYTTRGDNNNLVDTKQINTSDIYGKVLFKIPKLGLLFSFFNKPSNFFLWLLIPTILFLVYELFRIFNTLLYKKKTF